MEHKGIVIDWANFSSVPDAFLEATFHGFQQELARAPFSGVAQPCFQKLAITDEAKLPEFILSQLPGRNPAEQDSAFQSQSSAISRSPGYLTHSSYGTNYSTCLTQKTVTTNMESTNAPTPIA